VSEGWEDGDASERPRIAAELKRRDLASGTLITEATVAALATAFRLPIDERDYAQLATGLSDLLAAQAALEAVTGDDLAPIVAFDPRWR
jgi:hypothetical protein